MNCGQHYGDENLESIKNYETSVNFHVDPNPIQLERPPRKHELNVVSNASTETFDFKLDVKTR